MKYFWAWLATCVGVLVSTNFLDIPRQSPFPSFSRPSRNVRCSSSVHGTPARRNWINPSVFFIKERILIGYHHNHGKMISIKSKSQRFLKEKVNNRINI
ncbi:unnamed protein product [Spirodela intermedia]|uniref:Uncharacterized protein n=1 Tax=Spirodela intermedia TaxID=51605 RepID=A0A7I8JJP4_SPIIN|nr:unnamed protein product [Spirodela intermedia]CAA6669803.1 unnamed protein product [Spirodela intermedia]